MEAHYRVMARTVCELQWMTNILKALHVPYIESSLLYNDNTLIHHISNISSFHECTRDIKFDCHLVHEKLQLGLFHLLLISSSQ